MISALYFHSADVCSTDQAKTHISTICFTLKLSASFQDSITEMG